MLANASANDRSTPILEPFVDGVDRSLVYTYYPCLRPSHGPTGEAHWSVDKVARHGKVFLRTSGDSTQTFRADGECPPILMLMVRTLAPILRNSFSKTRRAYLVGPKGSVRPGRKLEGLWAQEQQQKQRLLEQKQQWEQELQQSSRLMEMLDRQQVVMQRISRLTSRSQQQQDTLHGHRSICRCCPGCLGLSRLSRLSAVPAVPAAWGCPGLRACPLLFGCILRSHGRKVGLVEKRGRPEAL